jgi:hypothetical protein
MKTGFFGRKTRIAALLLLVVAAVSFITPLAGINGHAREALYRLMFTDLKRKGHSDYLASLTRRSLANGFDREEVKVLAPVEGEGREVVARRLLASIREGRFGQRLQRADLKQTAEDDKFLTFEAEGSYLEIFRDGSKFRYRAEIDNEREAALSRAYGRIEQPEIEQLGYRFIKEELRGLVDINEGESLTFLGSRYMHTGGSDLEGNATDQIVASIGIFGREIEGIPVIGSGSKIAVWFSNDRQPVGFDVDWPRFRETGISLPTLPQEKLFDRIEKTTFAPQKAYRTRVKRFECGYVDLGASKRGSYLQPGCSLSFDGTLETADGETFAKVEFIPAGRRVLEDKSWHLARLIANGLEPDKREPQSIDMDSAGDPGIFTPILRRLTPVLKAIE